MSAKAKKAIFFVALCVTFLVALVCTAVISNADSYYTVRINYLFKDGTPAHDAYIAAYRSGADVDVSVTNPEITGFTPMTAIEGGDSALITDLEYDDISENKTINVYYIAGLTYYRVIYYKQNIYDDLYTRVNNLPASMTDRYGYTGSNPTDLEDVEFDGFTNLFHEPDAIAADGSTVFRVYYDRNYYSVNFDLGDDGYGVDTVYAKYQSVYHIGEPKRMGYEFLGWAQTSADSSDGTYGEDWFYLDEDGNPLKDEKGAATVDIDGNEVDKSGDSVTPVAIADGEVPLGDTYYRAMWNPTTTKYSIVYWVENPDSTITQEQMDAQTTTEDLRTLVTSNFSVIVAKDFVNVPSNTEVEYSDMIRDYDLFYTNKTKKTNRNLAAEFESMSAAQLDELNGKGRYFELNEWLTKKNFKDNLRPDMKSEVIPPKKIAGDGTTRINVYYMRKNYTMKFFYARQGFSGGTPDPNKVSLTNSSKKFSQSSYKNINSVDEGYMYAVSRGTWSSDVADSLPHLRSKYTDPESEDYIEGLEEKYEDYKAPDSSTKYRYWYYEVSAKYNAPLENKWLIDAVTDVHKKNFAENEMCKPGSWAVEYYTNFYNSHKGVGNYTVKGFYERLTHELMFKDSKYDDNTELHYLCSWTNTEPKNNNWNYGINRVLHFKYENYTELLPKEVVQAEAEGAEAVKASGGYTIVRTFTFVDDTTGESVTKWYGLKPDNIVNTTDSGDQYERGYTLERRNLAVRLNQTASEITGFKIENYRTYDNEDVDGDNDVDSNDTKYNGQLVLNSNNTEINWDDDAANDRHATVRFFYRRLVYTLKFRNGNNIDREFSQAEGNGVAYGISLNKKYASGENAGEYIYKYTPVYPNPDLRDYYEFEGWYYTPYYYRKVNFDTQTMPADDLTLYAHWVPKTIKISFYENYNDYYVSTHNADKEERIRCIPNPDYDKDDPESVQWLDGDIVTNYGGYIPSINIPANTDDEDVMRPVLTPPAEGAQFAGWYYLRDNVPVRFEPENITVTALNADAAQQDAKLYLFAEWVTKDVAKYKVNYVEKDHPETQVASSTTNRAFVYKTKTFNAKCGDELNAAHAWQEDGVNWWPTVNSHSLLIKANAQGQVYAPNEFTFEYVQKPSVHYKVQFLDASNRTPLREEVTNASTHASVEEDAPFIPGYVVTDGTKTLVLSASTKATEDEQTEEELETNVITFYYNKNSSEYLYEVEYYKQNTVGDGYTRAQEEQLAVPIASEGDTTVSLSKIYNRNIPKLYAENGFIRKAGATTVTEINGGTRTYSVADNTDIVITSEHRYVIRVYFDRNEYSYSYDYVDRTQEKLYNDTSEAEREGMWNGVIQSYTDQGPERVEENVVIHADEEITYNTIPYIRIDNKDIELSIAPTTEENPTVNHVKIYYRKYTERELQFKLACANEDSPYTEIDKDPVTGDPLYGGLSIPMQVVERYDDIQNVEFYNFNNAKVTGEGGVEDYVHHHKYNFLGWYDNPYGEGEPFTTNEILTKEDLGLTDHLPDRDKTYYAVVEQELVTANFEFRYIETELPTAPTGATLEERNAADDAAAEIVADAPSDPNGDYSGGYFDFTAPSTYENNTPIPWHRTDGYTMSIEPKDNRVYKYEFYEWWEEDLTRTVNGEHPLVRKVEWSNSGDGGWTPTALYNQVTRNGNKHIIAVYKRRDVTSMPYTIKYRFVPRVLSEGEDYKEFVVKGILEDDDKTPGVDEFTSNLTNAGCFELTDTFIMERAPYESNHGETLYWTNDSEYVVKTSYNGDGETADRIETIVTARQVAQKAYAHYRLTDSGAYTTIKTTVGSNRGMDSQLEALNLTGNENFSYWAIRQTETGPIIAKCYDPWFTYRVFSNYWISPVFTTGTNSVRLDPSAIAVGNEDWLAWTWNDGEDGIVIRPDSNLVFEGLKDKAKFVRVPAGTTTIAADWSNRWNETDDFEVQDGYTYRLTHFGEYGTAMYGTWGANDLGKSVNIARIDYSRNRWTDAEGNVAADGSTDLLFSDYEVDFSFLGDKMQNNSDYTIGLVFELCGTLDGESFNPDAYNEPSDFTKLERAVLAVKNKTGTPTSYKYDGTNSRKIQINEVSTADLTNKNRLEVSKYYKNKSNHTNRDAIMKVTAYVIYDGKATFSNSVYACMNSVGTKDLAKDNDSDAAVGYPYADIPVDAPYIPED